MSDMSSRVVQDAPLSPDRPQLISTTDFANDSAPETSVVRRVVSVSLGSPSRDHIAQTTVLRCPFSIERRGVNGDLKAARQLIQELDGKVDAIGLGGIDLYLVAGSRRYAISAAVKLARAAHKTPVVDGSGLKDTLERETIRKLQQAGTLDFRGRKVLLTCAVDRFGMAEEIVRAGARATFGDFLFVLGLPIPLRSLRAVRRIGALVLPIACRLPFKMLYPTGDQQTEIRSNDKYAQWYDDAEIIAGDFLLIRRFLPERLDGKTILTNTVTGSDIELLRARGARMLITTTPEFSGRSFGTNVMEGIFAAMGARTTEQYRQLLNKLDWQPRVINLNS